MFRLLDIGRPEGLLGIGRLRLMGNGRPAGYWVLDGVPPMGDEAIGYGL